MVDLVPPDLKEARSMDTAQDRRRKPELHTTLAAILAHPLRCRILAIAAGRVVSPKELALQFEQPLGNVSYHVRKLESMGWLELVEEKRRRGANEHFYRATELPVLSSEDLASMSPEERREFHLICWQMLTASAGAALDVGTYASRPEASVFRIPGTVDEQGWQELDAVTTEFFDRVFGVIEASANRLNEEPEATPIPIVVGGAFFESAI